MADKKKSSSRRTSSASKKKKTGSKSQYYLRSLIILLVILAALFIGDQFGLISVNWDGLYREVILGETAVPSAEQTVEMTDAGMITPDPETAANQTGSDGWYQLYFTTTQYPDKPETRSQTIMTALIDVINSAQSSLDIAIYELDLEEVGDALLEARQRGVDVRIVTDTDTFEKDETLIRLDKEKFPIVPDERSAIMHNKFVVVDGNAVWTGSWNFTTNGTYRNNNHGIFIQSPKLASNYGLEFEEMFIDNAFGPKSPADTPNPQVTVGGTLIETCFAPEDKCGQKITEVVNTAEKSIHFMVFSFTHDDIGKAIGDRAKDGVLVRGIFETRGSETEYSEYTQLRKKKLDVIQDGNPYVLHHKVIVIDEDIVILGSFNFSNNADKSNDENILIVYNSDIADQFLAEFDRLYSLAENPPN